MVGNEAVFNEKAVQKAEAPSKLKFFSPELVERLLAHPKNKLKLFILSTTFLFMWWIATYIVLAYTLSYFQLGGIITMSIYSFISGIIASYIAFPNFILTYLRDDETKGD